MIYHPRITFDENNRELVPAEWKELPFVCNDTELDSHFNRSISWHWHATIEIMFMLEGVMTIQTPDSVYVMQPGEICFVNANELHYLEIGEGMERCRFYTCKFDTHFITGLYSSVIERKYVNPILNSRSMRSRKIDSETQESVLFRKYADTVFDLSEKESFGYELKVRDALTGFWLLLFREMEQTDTGFSAEHEADIERVKTMMQYIQDNYMTKISLQDIADTAGIGERECGRCFIRCIGMSPVTYLNHYRVQMAARKLLLTAEDITSISMSCGFLSPSYFGKLFRRQMHCSPREFRRQNDDHSKTDL